MYSGPKLRRVSAVLPTGAVELDPHGGFARLDACNMVDIIGALLLRLSVF